MRILVASIIIFFLQISCNNYNVQPNISNSEINEIEYKMFNPFISLTRKITALPNEIKYYEKSWIDSSKWDEKNRTLSLPTGDWNRLISSFNINEFFNLKDFYENPDSIPLMDGDTISIEVRTSNRIKKVSYYCSSENVPVIDSLEKILQLFLKRFD